MEPSTKKRKRQSPFRIKVGCVVALRYRPTTGNHVTMIVPPEASSETNKPKKHAIQSLAGSEAFAEVWTDPIPGRDEGLALIGRRVRCCFVRPISAPTQQMSSGGAKTKSYIVQGEVVSVLDYGSKGWLAEQQKGRRKRTSKAGFTVELLVDRDILTKAPFLQRVDEDIDINKLKKESAKKTQRNEEIVRGKNKVTVKVTLEDPSGLVPHEVKNNNNNNNNDDMNRDIAKWAIRKRIPNKPGKPLEEIENKKKRKPVLAETAAAQKSSNLTKPEDNKPNQESLAKPDVNGDSAKGDKTKDEKPVLGKNDNNDEIPTPNPSGETKGPAKKKRKVNGGKKAANLPTQYMGDGNDEPSQQQRNWRWFAARYHDMYLSESKYTRSATINNHDFHRYEYYLELLSSCGGFIGEVLDVSPSSKAGTLAMVTLRRLILPEHTAGGRLAFHNKGNAAVMEIFDDYDSALFDSRKNVITEALSNQSGDEANGGLPSIVFRVPIEELIIVARQVNRHLQNGESSTKGRSEDSIGQLHISSSYSLRADCRVPLAAMTTKNGEATTLDQISNGKVFENFSICHQCRRLLPNSEVTTCSNQKCSLARTMVSSSSDSKVANQAISWCKPCLKRIQTSAAISKKLSKETMVTLPEKLPCCGRNCDCRPCGDNSNLVRAQFLLEKAIQNASDAKINEKTGTAACPDGQPVNGEEQDPLAEAHALVKSLPKCTFNIPLNLLSLDNLPLSSGKPVTRVKALGKRGKKKSALSGRKSPAEKRKLDSASKQSSKKLKANIEGNPRFSGANGNGELRLQRKLSEDYSVFKPTCSRFMDYNEVTASKSRFVSGLERENKLSSDKPRNLRELAQKDCRLLTAEKDEKTTSSRRMRASQRRLMKDFSAIGATSLGLDTLAGREQQLRFDRSSIHAWGVFADEEISAGDMIVEYRGELIGNAMAEKREREYELAKIGSDYMFRIDNLEVCDATKQGNVARFINASCDPNCYTKIITLDGKQRIVIYAKKDIKVGEELCYDYKFPIEYDESKRIPCHCGARECRGYMNWVRSLLCFFIVCTPFCFGFCTHMNAIYLFQDKRYVVMPGGANDTKKPNTATS